MPVLTLTPYDAALAYVTEFGWSCIPAKPDTKLPYLKWKEFQTRLPTPEELHAWWTQWPDALVAIITGHVSNLVVVDIDPRHGGDERAWLAAEPTVLRSRTRSGGLHCYYAHPADYRVSNSASRLAVGCDVRGDGGYVIAPPSVGYRWEESGPGARRTALYRVLPVFTGVEEGAPLHRGEGWDRARRDVRDQSISGSTVVRTEHWIEQTLKGVAHGERNTACARLAGYFLSRGDPQDVVTQTLINWNQLNDPPLPESEIRTTVESVARTAADNESRVRATSPARQGNTEDGGYSLISFASYMAKYGDKSVQWLVNDWLPQETVGLVVAPPGTYKTWLLQDLAVSVALRVPFLGQFEVNDSGPVLFMQQEDHHGQIAARWGLIATHRLGMTRPTLKDGMITYQFPPEIPIFQHEHRRFRLDNTEIMDAWFDMIDKLRPKLIILDPLYSAGKLRGFMEEIVEKLWVFKYVRDTYRTTVLIAHHTRKEHHTGKRSGGIEREDAWGMQFLNAWLETGWQIRRREALGTASVLRHFKVQHAAPESVVSFHIDTTQQPSQYQVQVSAANGNGADTVDLVKVLEQHGPQTAPKLAALSGTSTRAIYRRIQNLLNAGVILKQGNDYHLAETYDT